MNRWRLIVVVVGIVAVVAACGVDTPVAAPSPGASQPDVSSTATPPSVQPSSTVEVEVATDAASEPETVAVDAAAVSETAAVPASTRRSDSPASIRDVDFDNGVSYPVPAEDELLVEVSEGFYQDGDEYGITLRLDVTGVRFGDIDADGVDEAAVSTSTNFGGSGQFSAVHVFEFDDTAPASATLIDSIVFGDRSDGGLWHHEIVEGQLVTDTFSNGQGACCPTEIERRRFELDGGVIGLAERHGSLRWMVVDSFGDYDGNRPELRFVPGTSAAVLRVVAGEEIVDTWFEAGAGQQLVIEHLRDGVADGIELVGPDGSVVATSNDGSNLSFELTSSGRHDVRFQGPVGAAGISSGVYLVTIGQAAAVPTNWTSEHHRLVVSDEPLAVFSHSRPVFPLDDGGIVNGVVDRWIGDKTDWWIADVIEYPPLDRDDSGLPQASHEWAHEVTYATDEIVSVRWDWYEYVCCRPYPNHGQASLIVDLAESRQITDDEILDLERLDEIHELWLAAHEQRYEWRPERLPSQRPGWSSLSLVPGGVEFGTDRQGAAGSTATVVTWQTLGDLARPSFVERVAGGAVPTGW